MENFFQQIKSITSWFPEAKKALVVGGGKINRELITKFKDNIIININESVFEVDGEVVIVKNRRSLKNIILNDKYLDDRYFIIPSDIIEADEIDYFKNLILIEDFREFQQYDFNLFNNMPIFGCVVAQALGITDIHLSGFTFDVDEYTGDKKKYNQMYFKKQKEELCSFIVKNPHLHLTIDKGPSFSRDYFEPMKTIESVIADRFNNNETIIVAEFTNNHLGDMSTLFEMVRLAAEQGADLIKIQKRDVDNFYTDAEKQKPYDSKFGNTLYAYRNGVELADYQIEAFAYHCESFNIPWFSTVLDHKSFQDLEKVKPQMLIKLPSTISEFQKFLKRMSDDYPADRDIVVSTGATDYKYIEKILAAFYNGQRRLFLLHTLSAYPTPLEDINVGVINLYKKLQAEYPLLYPGYSGHDIGVLGTQMAIAAGAVMVEKHVKLEDNEWIHFDGVASALKNGEFAEYVQAVRQADRMRGKEQKIVHSIEHHKYNPATDRY